MKFVSVGRVNNPKSENNGKWIVYASDDYMKPMQMVFMNRSKKVCIEYANMLTEKPIISNGVEYGAKF